MGIAKAKEKATWLKLSAGEGGTGFLFYSVVKGVDADGKKIYEDIQCKEGLENVYFAACRFHLEEGRDGKPPTKKLQATFVDAETDEIFIISTGWATSLSRYIVYNCYHNDIDPAKPFTVVKTFLGKDAMANGFKPVIPLMSQVQKPRSGDYLKNFLSLHIQEGILQKTVTITDRSTGRSYQDYDWATILDPLVTPLNERLKAAAAAREASQPSSASSEDYSSYDDSGEDYSYEDEGFYPEESSPVEASSFYAAFGATTIEQPQSTVVDELTPFFDQLGFEGVHREAFYRDCFRVKNTLEIIAAGKLDLAKDYLTKLISLYAIAAEVLPSMAESEADQKAVSALKNFADIKGLPGVSTITQSLEKAQGLKDRQMDF